MSGIISVHIFGNKGRFARTSVAAVSPPSNVAAEVEKIAALEQERRA